LKPLAAGLVAATVAVPLATAATPDPIYSAIEQFRAAAERVNGMRGSEDPQWNESLDIEWDLLKQLTETKPQTLVGLVAFVDCLADYPELDDYFSTYGSTEFMTTIAESLRDILAKEA